MGFAKSICLVMDVAFGFVLSLKLLSLYPMPSLSVIPVELHRIATLV